MSDKFEPLTPENQRVFLIALTKAGALSPVCPVCANRTWAVQGIYALNGVFQPLGDESMVPDGHALPIIAANCEKCGYIIQFAWKHIQRMAGHG